MKIASGTRKNVILGIFTLAQPLGREVPVQKIMNLCQLSCSLMTIGHYSCTMRLWTVPLYA